MKKANQPKERRLQLIPDPDKIAGTRVPGVYCAHAAACPECGPQSRGVHCDASFIKSSAAAMQILLEEARATQDSAKREGFLVAADGLAWAIAYFARSVQDDTLGA